MKSSALAALALIGALAPIGAPIAHAAPCPAPEARAFDFWIGSWDVENLQRNPATPDDPTLHPTGSATVRVHPVAGGCAVVEHWQGDLVYGEVRGFSVRSWDPEAERWTLVLNWPSHRNPVSRFSTLHGTFEHWRGTFERTTTTPEGDPLRVRFTFSDIADDHYRWQAHRSVDGGVSWIPGWIMRATRRPADAPAIDPDQPAFEVPEDPLCDEPEHRALDGLLGRWEGHTDGPLSELPVTVEVRAILGGCALTEQWTIDEAEHFAVRAWDATEGRWVAWRVASDDPVLRRLEGPGSGEPVFGYEEGDERARERWIRKGKRRIWQVEEAHGDENWSVDLRAFLKPAK